MTFSRKVLSVLSNWRIALVALILLVGILLANQLGAPKAGLEIDYLDVLGEGSTLLLTLLAVTLVITTRPRGRVTDHFYIGGLVLLFSMILDVLDEFFRYPDDLRLLSWLESLPQPIGLAIIAIGAYEWRREHRLVQRQLQTREMNLRVHQWVDPLTTLYTKPYFEYVLDREIALADTDQHWLYIASINLRNFAQFNRELGTAAGDELLHQTGEMITLMLRATDCVCRDHSDRFLVVLPQTQPAHAQILLANIRESVLKELALPAYMDCHVHVHRVTEASAELALTELDRATHHDPQYDPIAVY